MIAKEKKLVTVGQPSLAILDTRGVCIVHDDTAQSRELTVN